MGTILGPMPLFLLGHHSLTPDRTQLVPPVTHTDTREIQKAGRHHKGQKPCSRPKARERFPCLWAKLCCKSLGSPGTETIHMQVQGGG